MRNAPGPPWLTGDLADSYLPRAPAFIATIGLFRHDALKAHSAGCIEQGGPVTVMVFANLNRAERIVAPDQFSIAFLSSKGAERRSLPSR